MGDVPETQDHAKGFLGFVERAGNKLPDPVFIFLFLLVVLVIISVIASLAGLTATQQQYNTTIQSRVLKHYLNVCR
mgnify:CR=1 FL=1